MPNVVITYYGEETAADAILQFLKKRNDTVDGCFNHTIRSEDTCNENRCACQQYAKEIATVAVNAINRG